jgi:hypothetical protein
VARIVALKRYISLLRLEEKRLKWLDSSPVSAVADRVQAAVSVAQTTAKLHGAERELATLQIARR